MSTTPLQEVHAWRSAAVKMKSTTVCRRHCALCFCAPRKDVDAHFRLYITRCGFGLTDTSTRRPLRA